MATAERLFSSFLSISSNECQIYVIGVGYRESGSITPFPSQGLLWLVLISWMRNWNILSIVYRVLNVPHIIKLICFENRDTMINDYQSPYCLSLIGTAQIITKTSKACMVPLCSQKNIFLKWFSRYKCLIWTQQTKMVPVAEYQKTLNLRLHHHKGYICNIKY